MNYDELVSLLENEYFKIEQEFGYGKFYQSLPILSLPGMRPTDKRIIKYNLEKFLKKDQRVVDLGCNCGFFDISIANMVKSITGIEYNDSLVKVATMAKDGLQISNVEFISDDYNSWIRRNKNKYDVIFSFAVHHWFGVKPYGYAKDLTELLNPGGLLFFESQDITGDVLYKKICRELEYRGMQLCFHGSDMDDGLYERAFFVYQKGIRKHYLLNRLSNVFKIKHIKA